MKPNQSTADDNPLASTISGARVLCVDDDPLSTHILTDMLTQMGYQVFTARSGPEALKLLQQQSVDLILLDVVMPQMDGYETCRRILAHPEWQRIPIIMVTSLSDREALHNGLRAGAVDFIVKPFDDKALSIRIQNLLKLKMMGDQLQHNHQAVLDFTDKMEKIAQFQGRIDIPSSSIPTIWHIFLDEINFALKVAGCALFMVDPTTHEFVLEEAVPREHAELSLKEMEIQVESGVFAWVINRRQPALIPSLLKENPYTILMLPLATTRRTLGVIMVLTPTPDREITQETIKLLGLLTKQTALVMENTLLYDHLKQKQESLEQANAAIKRLSVTDPLTGAFNRGYLAEHLPIEIKRARRYDHWLGVILCDIDLFKTINDTCGHQAGDAVLKEFVQRLQVVIRTDIDWIVRFGGEEFVLVLPDTDPAGSLQLAERLRQTIVQTPFIVPAKELAVSASFGVCSLNPVHHTHIEDDAELAEQMINTADVRLYQAKQNGRNRVEGGA